MNIWKVMKTKCHTFLIVMLAVAAPVNPCGILLLDVLLLF